MFQQSEAPAVLAGVDACRSFFAGCLEAGGGKNSLWVAHLDPHARCIDLAAYPGTAARLPVPDILKRAAEVGGVGLVVAEHQAGPAAGACGRGRWIRALARAAEAMDISVLDHLVFTDGRQCTSLRRAGLL